MKKTAYFTVSRLASMAAAAIVVESTAHKNGNHATIEDTVQRVAKEQNFRDDVVERTLKVFHHHFGFDTSVPKTGSTESTFGKRYTDTKGKHAINSVRKNAQGRANALNKVSTIAKGHWTTWYK